MLLRRLAHSPSPTSTGTSRSFSHAGISPSEFLSSTGCWASFDPGNYLLGSLPSPRRHSGMSTTTRRSHSLFCSVPRCSQPLDGFLHSAACELVSSHCRAQDCFPFRGLSVPRSRPLSSSGCCLPGVSRRAPIPASWDAGTRGCAFEALLHVELRIVELVVNLLDGRLPSSGFLLLQVFRATSDPGSPDRTPMALISAPPTVQAQSLTTSTRLRRLASITIESPVSGSPNLLELSSLP